MSVRNKVFAVLLFLSVQPMAHAEREMRKSVRSIHAPIPTQGASLQGTRLAILYGMHNNKAIKWVYEGETPNSVMARWDYRGNSVLARIVYDQNQIQILYVDASTDLACQDLEAGVCHKGTPAYFNYIPHLRISIEREIRWHRTKPGTENSHDESEESQEEANP